MPFYVFQTYWQVSNNAESTLLHGGSTNFYNSRHLTWYRSSISAENWGSYWLAVAHVRTHTHTHTPLLHTLNFKPVLSLHPFREEQGLRPILCPLSLLIPPRTSCWFTLKNTEVWRGESPPWGPLPCWPNWSVHCLMPGCPLSLWWGVCLSLPVFFFGWRLRMIGPGTGSSRHLTGRWAASWLEHRRVFISCIWPAWQLFLKSDS